jgi:hypothetical protein
MPSPPARRPAASTGRRRARRAATLLAGLAATCPLAAEAQVVRFEHASYSVAENIGSPLGNLEICLVRTGDLSQRIDAFISTEDGTATGSASVPPGQIYDYISRTDAPVFFFPGVARACQIVPILDDSLEEGDETFRVRITGTIPPVQIGSPSVATVTILDDESAPDGLVVSFLDHGHRWPQEPLIPYEITIRNFGPPVPGLVVTEVVPVQTLYVAAESTPGWSCNPGPDEGSRCELPLGDLATGASRTIVFAVQVLDGTPETFEVLNSFSLRSNVDAAAAPVRTATGDGVPSPSPGGTWVTFTPRNDAPALGPPRESPCESFHVSATRGGECTVQRITFDGLGCCFSAFGYACKDVCLISCSN